MNAIINVEVLMLLHRTFCQYAPNIQYQYVYPYVQGAYYQRYANDGYELNRDIRKRQKYVGFDIYNIQLDNKHKRLKCKCSKKHCKKEQVMTNQGSCCQSSNEYTGNYYQYDNKDCNGYHIGTSTPDNLYKPFRFITAPSKMFKPLNVEEVLDLFIYTTTAKSVTTSSQKPDEGKTGHDGDEDETTTTQYTTYKDTRSTRALFATKTPLLFKDSSIKILCPQRRCYKKIGKYYVNDIIPRPTLGNRQKRYLDANDTSPGPRLD